MNVLIIAYKIDKYDISEAQVGYEWIKRLSQVVNITLVTAGSRLSSTTGLEGCTNINIHLIKPRFNFKMFDTIDRLMKPGYIDFFYQSRKIIPELIVENNIDLCHHLTPQAIRHQSPLMRFNTPYIIGPIHGGLDIPAVAKELQVKEGWTRYIRKIDRWRNRTSLSLKKTYQNAQLILVSAPYVRDLIPKVNTPFKVLSGIGVTLPSRNKQRLRTDKTFKIISVGRIEALKGFEILIEALGKLKNKKNIELHIFGKGSCLERFQTLSKTIGVDSMIHWHGFIANDKIIEQYQQMDLFALPSLREPAGIVFLEAMSCGLPVLCVDSGGPAYYITPDVGIKIPLGSKEDMINAFAKNIDFLSSNTTAVHKMKHRATQRIKDHFTWNALTQQMLETYTSVLPTTKSTLE